MPDSNAQPPDATPPRPTLARVRLSPVQQAYSAYARHFLACLDCRSIDGERCETAAGLWASYQLVATAAAGQVRAAGKRPTGS